MNSTLDSKRKKLWKKFNTGQSKVLMMMTIAPGNEGVTNFVINKGGQINETNIQSYLDIGLQYVITQAEYMFPMKYSTWSVTTWRKKLNQNAIMRKGSDNDQAWLEASNTRYNNPHNPKSKMKLPNIQVTVQRRLSGNI